VFRYRAKLPLDEDLVGVERLGREVVSNTTEHHVEVGVSPKVVPGQLLAEDLPESRPEVTKLVRALE